MRIDAAAKRFHSKKASKGLGPWTSTSQPPPTLRRSISFDEELFSGLEDWDTGHAQHGIEKKSQHPAVDNPSGGSQDEADFGGGLCLDDSLHDAANQGPGSISEQGGNQ